MNCSIGLSGVIFGFAIFELMNVSSCTLAAATALVAMITLPSIKNASIDIVGHLTGVMAGLIVALLFKYLKK